MLVADVNPHPPILYGATSMIQKIIPTFQSCYEQASSTFLVRRIEKVALIFAQFYELTGSLH